ncbi:MAG: DUF2007 domain-containing protein [Gallionella sp.]
MKKVYEAASGLDGHMILNLLEQYRISGRIDGEYLQGGIGELQVMGYVRVMVKEADYDHAKQIISEWESIQPPVEESRQETGAASGTQLFFAGLIIGAALMYWLMKIETV